MRNDELETQARFAERYGLPPTEVHRAIEQDVIGSDWGANGYTTRAQADEMAVLVGARPGVRLLDLGAGRGWPGLYLAAASGCAVVLTDLPIEGLREAARRAADENLAHRVGLVVASAARTPFRPASFDAAVSSDVLC